MGEPIARIAICTVGELFGGVERHVLAMIAGLAAHHIDVLLMVFHDGELAARARMLGIRPVVVCNRNAALLATSRRLARVLQEQGVRIVHVHGYKAAVFCALARRWYPFAILKTEHGLPEPTAGGAARAFRGRFYYWLDTVATRMARATVCYVTEDMRRHYARAHAGLPAFVVPNGIRNMDRDQFPRPSQLREEWFNLLIVGRLDSVKGHEVAIEVLVNDGVASDVHLHVVGTGPRELELRALASDLGIAERVHILGFQHNAYDYIAHCDALLMPSLHEGLPYTLLEAMALGVPVIASSVGGLAEVIEHDATGLLVAPRNVEALAAAVQRVREDSVLRTRIGDGARQLQRRRYSLEAMTERYVQIYRNLPTT